MKDTKNSGSKFIQVHQYRSGNWNPAESGVIVEAPVSLTVNGEVWLTFMCTPGDLEALAAGFLFNEGVIASPGEIADVRVCEHGDNVDVWLNHAAQKPVEWRRTSGCTGGITATDATDTSPVPLNGVLLAPETIHQLIVKLFDSQDLYRQVGGVHTSALSDGHEIRVVAEDIGRHNSVDKLAGLCLLKGIELPRKVLLTTGRISSEMLQKSARLGAAVVVSRTSPSSLSIELAERLGVTLIGYARRDRFTVYTHPERLLPETVPEIARSRQG